MTTHDIELSDVEIRTSKEDLRPAFFLDGVEGAAFARIRTPRVAGVPMFSLHGVSDFSAHLCRNIADAHFDSVDDREL